MEKSQKKWPWIFAAMFLIPEILFSFILSFVASFRGIENFPFIYHYFINPHFFVDNPIYLFIVLSIECLGMLGLLIWNIKFNDNKYKTAVTIFGVFVLMLLVLIFYVGYAFTNMSFP